MTISSRISSRFSITLVLAASVALGASAVACSSSSSDSGEVPTNGGGDGGGSNGDGGGTSGNLDGGGGGGDSATQTGPVKSGFVMVSQSTFGSTTSHSAMAGFSTTHTSIGTGGTSCTVSTEGSCQVMTCAVQDAGTSTTDASVEAGASQDTVDSAGNVTISGGKLASPIVLTPDSKNNTYAVNSGTGQVFAGGDMVKVSAAGATVPAFESNVAAPGDITVTAPAFSSFATSFSKSSDLNITWTGGAAGDVNVSISSVGAKVVTISCKFAANGGSGTVPKAALNDIGSSGSIAISPSVVTSLKAGDYNVVYTLAGTGAAGSFTAN